jgi:putative membrane protein
MLVAGIVYHVQFMLGLRHERKAMKAEGLVHAESKFPPSMTLIIFSNEGMADLRD